MELHDAIKVKNPFMNVGDVFIKTGIWSTDTLERFCEIEKIDIKKEILFAEKIWDKEITEYARTENSLMIYVASLILNKNEFIPPLFHVFWRAPNAIHLVHSNANIFKASRRKNNDGSTPFTTSMHINQRVTSPYDANHSTLLGVSHNTITAQTIDSCNYFFKIEKKLEQDGSFAEVISFGKSGSNTNNYSSTINRLNFLNTIATNLISSKKCIVANTLEGYELLTV